MDALAQPEVVVAAERPAKRAHALTPEGRERIRQAASRPRRKVAEHPLQQELRQLFQLARKLTGSRETERQAAAKLREIKGKIDGFFGELGI